MSLITRCPACTTMFKVVPDQLRVSDGWVRCGQCDEVFDANAHLQSLEHAPAPVKQSDPNPFAWGESLEVDGAPQQPKIELDFPDAPEQTPLDGDVFESELSLEQTAPPALEGGSIARDPMAAVPADDLGALMPGTDEVTTFLSHSELEPVSRLPLEVQSDAMSAPTPNFLKPMRSVSRQHSRSARFVIATANVLSACLLLGQWLVYERDRIAATAPATLGFFEPLCGVLGCNVSPLRQIESLVIDSSSFGKTQADVYRLGFVIKSTALVDVALPSLELTLTDAQDTAVVRRVFSPQDLGSQIPTLAAGGEWGGAVPVTFKPPAGAERIAGYRLLAFYP